MNLEYYYDYINSIVPETCKITGISLVSSERQKHNIYHFLAEIKAPTGIEDFTPKKNDISKIRNEQCKNKNLPSLSISNKITIQDGDKKKVMILSSDVNPSNIYHFSITDGIITIHTECYGTFY